MLFSRLQLTVPDARSFMVAPVRRSVQVRDFGDDLAATFERASYQVRRIDLDETDRGSHRAEIDRTEASVTDPQVGPKGLSHLSNLAEVRGALAGFQGVTVVSATGLLDNPEALLYGAAVDAVIIVVARGKTSRDDLRNVRIEIERFGGRLAGAVFMA